MLRKKKQKTLVYISNKYFCSSFGFKQYFKPWLRVSANDRPMRWLAIDLWTSSNCLVVSLNNPVHRIKVFYASAFSITLPFRSPSYALHTCRNFDFGTLQKRLLSSVFLFGRSIGTLTLRETINYVLFYVYIYNCHKTLVKASEDFF